jgi:hypothetical protein
MFRSLILLVRDFSSLSLCFVEQKTTLGPLDNTFMARMTDLCSQKWFFGGISTETAVKTLLNEPRGAFLVRFWFEEEKEENCRICLQI